MQVIPIIVGAAGGLMLFRGLYRSNRALVPAGKLKFAGGSGGFLRGCDPFLEIETKPQTNVYCVAPGKVLLANDDMIHILATNEPVVLVYGGVRPTVTKGQYVGVGQSIGATTATFLYFAAYMAKNAEFLPMPPTAWLASRGLAPVAGQGSRDIKITKEQRQGCSYVTPDRAGFALLPVSVEFK
jgi:hypothetical protein